MTNLENQSLDYHSHNHYYFRDSYIDMQKRCSKLNYELGKMKYKKLLHCTACLTVGVGFGVCLGIILGGFRNGNQNT